MLIEAGADIQEAFIHFGQKNDVSNGLKLINTILQAPASNAAAATFVGIGTKRQSPYLKGHGRDIPVLIGKTMKGMSKIPNQQQLLHLLSPGEMLKRTNDRFVLRNISSWYGHAQNFKTTK